MNNKIIQSKCKNILSQNEDMLKYIIDAEKKLINRRSKIGENEYDTIKNVFMDEGIKKGLIRFLELLNEFANKEYE